MVGFKNNIDKHITRIIVGAVLIIILLFFVRYNKIHHHIVETSQKLNVSYSYLLMYWGVILVAIILFVAYVLPSIIYVIKTFIKHGN